MNRIITGILLIGLLFLACTGSRLQNVKFFIEQHEWDKAIMELEEVVSENPQDAEGHYLLGDLYGRKGQYEKMRTHFEISSKLTDAFDSEMDYKIKKYWLENYNQGVAFFNKGDLEAAIPKFIQATVINPELPDAFIMLANTYLQQGDYQKAIEAYQQAIRLDKKDIVSRMSLAWIYFQNKDYYKTIEVCREIVKLNPAHGEATLRLAFCFDLLGDLDSAVNWYQKAIELTPSKNLHLNLGIVFFKKNDFYRAIDQFNRALSFDSLDVNVYSYLGESYWRLQDYERMIPCYQKITELEPDNKNAWKNLIVGYSNLGLTIPLKEAKKKLEELHTGEW